MLKTPQEQRSRRDQMQRDHRPTLVSFAQDLTKSIEPQTCGNYFSHLSNIFAVARPAWGYPLSRQEFDDALTVLRKLGLIRKGGERDRRPTLEELDRLMEHFGRIRENRPSSIPMQKIVAFALFSTRRQEEITLLRWDDLDGRSHSCPRHEASRRQDRQQCLLRVSARGARNHQVDAARQTRNIPLLDRCNQHRFHTRLQDPRY